MLNIINIDDGEKWDKIIKSFKDYDIYYLSGYVKAFQVHGDGEPILFYYEDENIKAANVVMKRDIELDINFKGKIRPGTFFDIATPYGYGGFIIEGDVAERNIQNLNHVYSQYCKDYGIISEFVRFHPIIKNSSSASYLYDVIDLGRTITLNLKTTEQIWNNLSSKNRNVIRKAKKSGVNIYWGRSSELINKFIPLYNGTMDKDDAIEYYYFDSNFYQSIIQDIKYNSLVFYAIYEDKIISMSIILFSNNQMHYHLSASDRKHQNLAATNLLLYEAACWGCENGFKTLHLGGGLGSQEDNLFKFKKAFNKNSDTYFSIGKKIFNKEKYDELVEIRKQDLSFDANMLFFPLYRG